MRHAEATLNEATWKKALELVFEQTAEAAVLIRADGCVLRYNEAYVRLSAHDPARSQAQRIWLPHEERSDEFVDWAADPLPAAGTWRGIVPSRRMDGQRYTASVRLHRIPGEHADAGGPLLVLARDVSEQTQYEQWLRYLAEHDTLTGLSSASLLAHSEWPDDGPAAANTARGAVLVIDLDDFRSINESLGTAAGDELLMYVAWRLQSMVRSDDTVIRRGGDEFIVLLDRIASSADAVTVAEKLLACLREPLQVSGHDLFVTASVGISCYPDDGRDRLALVRNADSAMHEAKKRGRNCAVFYRPSMNEAAQRALEIKEQLHKALERNEFHLRYQPIVTLEDESTVALEALLRWHNERLGEVSPSEFIPIAEQSGMIAAIGRWTMQRACAEIGRLQRRGAGDFKLSLNVSVAQLQDEQILDDVFLSLSRGELDPRRLILEVTETVLIEHRDRVSHLLQALRRRGVEVAIDDFGAGYSSLSYLGDFAFDYLKIDRSFIRDIAKDSNRIAVVHSLLSIAHSFGMRAVAEGVENVRQREILRELGCDAAQGYMFAKPAVVTDFYAG